MLCDLLDAPTALAACCGFDLCHKYILYLYLYFETSSIPAERVFAILRLMEVPTRGSQLPATWARELRFRVMRQTLDGLLVAAVNAVELC